MQPATAPAHLGRTFIRTLDALLRRRYGVFEFSQDPSCVLRLSWKRCPENHVLADGTRLTVGERLANIHLWNEHLPAMSVAGPDLQWARRTLQHLTHSLRLLAQYLDRNPEDTPVRALLGEVGFLIGPDLDAHAPMLERLGFEVERLYQSSNRWRRFSEFWENLYSYLLIWTYNPASLRSKRLLRLERCRLWMSVEALKAYGERRRATEG